MSTTSSTDQPTSTSSEIAVKVETDGKEHAEHHHTVPTTSSTEQPTSTPSKIAVKVETDGKEHAEHHHTVLGAFALLHGAMAHSEPDTLAAMLPPVKTFGVTLLYSVLTVSAFTIAIPTSTNYTVSLGASASFSGLLVGLTPIFSGIMQAFLVPIFKKLPLKTVLLSFCGLNVLAGTIYALGDLSGSLAVVMIARCLFGTVGGPSVVSTYIARSTPPKARSLAMQHVGIGIGIGYALGPLLGVLTEAVCNAAGWTHPALNSNTAPGWLVVFLFLVEFALILVFFVEPKSGGPPPGSGGPPPPLAPEIKTRLAVALTIVYFTPINVGLWEVYTISIALTEWGWSIELAGILLALVNLGVVIGMLPPWTRKLADGKGAAVCLGLCALSQAFLFAYPLERAPAVVVYVLGSLLLLVAAGVCKAFVWGFVTKIAPISHRQPIMSAMAAVYMFGRGTGSTLGSVVKGNAFATTLLCLDAVGLCLVLLTYKLWTPVAEK